MVNKEITISELEQKARTTPWLTISINTIKISMASVLKKLKENHNQNHLSTTLTCYNALETSASQEVKEDYSV